MTEEYTKQESEMLDRLHFVEREVKALTKEIKEFKKQKKNEYTFSIFQSRVRQIANDISLNIYK